MAQPTVQSIIIIIIIIVVIIIMIIIIAFQIEILENLTSL